MGHPIAPQMKRQAQSLAFAAAFGLALMASPLTASPGAALAATPGPTPGPEATAEKGKAPPSDDMEFKELKERLRALGEAIRKAIENATRSFDRGQDDLT
ncbi:MAG: hypothetical protein V3T46_03840, partial [Alphaproteobacteria bacterium]